MCRVVECVYLCTSLTLCMYLVYICPCLSLKVLVLNSFAVFIWIYCVACPPHPSVELSTLSFCLLCFILFHMITCFFLACHSPSLVTLPMISSSFSPAFFFNCMLLAPYMTEESVDSNSIAIPRKNTNKSKSIVVASEQYCELPKGSEIP